MSNRARAQRARALSLCWFWVLSCADTSITILQDGGELEADDAAVTVVTESFVQAGHYADFLFVTDNSWRMGEEQVLLSDGVEHFLAGLEAATVDYRIAVISTDAGTGRYAWPESGCREGTGDGGRFRGAVITPSTEDGAATLRDHLMLGTSGCGFERPLDSLRLALADAQGTAEELGFFRPEAIWTIVFLTDEDDCSGQDAIYDPDDVTLGEPNLRCFALAESELMLNVSESAIEVARAQRSHTRVTLIAGALEPAVVNEQGTDLLPSCATDDVEARPPIRLAAFTRALGGVHESICVDDLRPALEGISTRAVAPLRSYCLKTAMPSRNCALLEEQVDGSQRLLPERGENSPGWRFARSTAAGCEHGAFLFDDASIPEAGSRVEIRCRSR